MRIFYSRGVCQPGWQKAGKSAQPSEPKTEDQLYKIYKWREVCHDALAISDRFLLLAFFHSFSAS
jgi:hypothetical protein